MLLLIVVTTVLILQNNVECFPIRVNYNEVNIAVFNEVSNDKVLSNEPEYNRESDVEIVYPLSNCREYFWEDSEGRCIPCIESSNHPDCNTKDKSTFPVLQKNNIIFQLIKDFMKVDEDHKNNKITRTTKPEITSTTKTPIDNNDSTRIWNSMRKAPCKGYNHPDCVAKTVADVMTKTGVESPTVYDVSPGRTKRSIMRYIPCPKSTWKLPNGQCQRCNLYSANRPECRHLALIIWRR